MLKANFSDLKFVEESLACARSRRVSHFELMFRIGSLRILRAMIRDSIFIQLLAGLNPVLSPKTHVRTRGHALGGSAPGKGHDHRN